MDAKISKVLLELEEVGRSSHFWNVPKSTGLFLNMMVQTKNAQKVLEIGTSNGYSGLYLAEALSHTGGRLYTVESHKERFAMATETFERAGVRGCVEQVFGHAPEILVDMKGGFDFVFVDATKLEYKSYVETILPKIVVGGLMIADNCLSHKNELVDFRAFIQQNSVLQSLLLPFDNGLLLSLKLS